MNTFKTAEIIVVGSEFFSRDKQDSNSIWLTEELERHGVRVLCKSTVTDDLVALTQVMKRGLGACDLVISTGGLGPTEDDRTREAAASALGLDLVYHLEIEEELKIRFASRGRVMSENNRRQAYIPATGQVIPNPNGTAPGFCCQGESSVLLALPGPPREMQGMFHHFLGENKAKLATGQFVTARRTLRVTGLGESDMDRRISDLYRDVKNPELTINFTPDDLEIHLTSKAENLEDADSLSQAMAEAIKQRLEGFLFSDRDESLAEVVVGLLRNRGLTLACAESVTGGQLAHKICSVPGASAAFCGSVVAYTNDCKHKLLGVSEQSLVTHSAVSEQVALEMVEGVKARTESDICLSCTGFAGPDGGTKKDPVGTCYIGFLTPEKASVQRISLPGNRNLIRSRVTQAMLFMLFRYLRSES